jgi:hypothetical protein
MDYLHEEQEQPKEKLDASVRLRSRRNISTRMVGEEIL